ncbi:GAF domain-containing protein [Oceanobacillus sp. J11TS1]|uniref:GAF domain-containing protein n=1 Tax=Oceanobacillus sp. J11TS1 TaxID=2807191 RepID=UPI001B1AD8EB|nr:GAF domain-containing protein [Oceanobacillus sp. J11TS1]GIO24103.1 hypothetical protein J11TS1_26840 [Oceanobacillus sp. J11TS1]
MSKTWKITLSYVIAFLLVCMIFLTISETFNTIHKWIYPDSQIKVKSIFLVICSAITIIFSTMALAREIRSNSDVVSLGTANIPNFMYHKDFEKHDSNDLKLIKENATLQSELQQQEEYNEKLLDELELKDNELVEVGYISDIFIRHHKNASRLVRSLLQLLHEGKPYWKWEFCNNVLDECVTILLEDRSDKSSTIYFINEQNELEMFAYNRIEFSSSRNRKFKKGEGFAGHIWKTGKTVLISNVSESIYFQGTHAPRHEYGSILGVPIKIGKDIVGVLCIQSEDINEFKEDDKRTVIFYADICALAHFYDKIANKRERV